ncbi:Hypothetical predicted protein [Cloeon dipterum]|uniref:WH2 domain-containing protein n=1 Tax=Cloeon dipterum TaxID=197152 RepID=A0A8S1DCZ6_9INSE|nr:Hypothetical predicted protein [Cloeon dipterum]
MAEPIYEVPVIHQDLRQDETIVQIADSLEYLQKCANQIFTKIESKLEESARKLNAIQQRTAVSKQNIQKLTGIKKATKVISSAKYPASDEYHPYKSIFPTDAKLVFTSNNIPIKSTIQIASDKNIQEKMQFYHVKNTTKMLRRNFEITIDEGLGNLPRNITSVSSLLLFNTTENPYKTNLADCFGLHYKIKHAVAEPQEAKTKPVANAMQSIPIEPETQLGFYSPGAAEVPELDIPMDLPNLPGIADDLDFSFSDSPPVAVPSPPSEPKPKPTPAPPPIRQPEATSPAPPAVIVPAAPAPPAAAPPPPPPPPPPPVGPIFVEATSNTPVEKKATPKPEVGDERANLMAAIRQAGGKMKLRSVSEKKMESKKKKQEEKEKVVSGDLMADLHAKLMLRRTV